MKSEFFKKIVLMVLVVGTALTSCSDDHDNLNDPGTDQGKYEKGYLSMSFINTAISNNLRSAGTRAASTEPGIVNESKVNNGLVVLYNTATNKVAYQFDLIEIATTPVPSSGIYTTEAREVNAALTYKVAVFLNYSQALKNATEVGDDITDVTNNVVKFTNGVTDFIEGSTSGTYDNFLMCNFAGLVDVDVIHIKDTPKEAKDNPVHVYVERAVAKVILTLDPALSSNVGVTVKDVKWEVDVLNNFSYWMRKQTSMLKDGTNSGVTVPEADVTPSMRDLMYAEDPNFKETSWEYWYSQYVLGNTLTWNTAKPWTTPVSPVVSPSSNQKSYMDAQYTYKTAANITRVAKVGIDTNADAASEWAYVPENTMVAEEQWEDATTSVLVSAVINPGKTALSETTLNDGDSYFVYRERVFSADELAKIDSDDNDIDGKGNDWDAIEAANPDLAGLQVFLQRKDVKKAITGSETGVYTSLTAASSSVKYGALSFYKGGLNVYNIPIRHFSDILQSKHMAYGRYGVVRNNVYKLTLKSIKNFGDIDIPDKGNPDDKSSWLSVEFEILEWVIREQGVEL